MLKQIVGNLHLRTLVGIIPSEPPQSKLTPVYRSILGGPLSRESSGRWGCPVGCHLGLPDRHIVEDCLVFLVFHFVNNIRGDVRMVSAGVGARGERGKVNYGV